MDALTQGALIGLGRAPVVPLDAGDAGERLCASLPDLSAERLLLLRAGVRAVRQRAGQQPETLPELPQAPEETNPSPAALTDSLREMFSSDRVKLVPEVCQLLKQAELTWPSELLPEALSVTDPRLREHLRPVLRDRAIWFSQFHPAWKWIAVGEAADPVAGRRAWDEATPVLRLSLLRQWRKIDPNLAREWLQEIFTTEKADQRKRLLEGFAIGLSAADLPFLAERATDRSEAVRQSAWLLLARLPGSDVSNALISGAESFLVLDRSTAEFPRIEVTLPDAAPVRGSKAPSGVGERAWWLRQWLSLIPPGHWATRWNLTPETLLAGLREEAYGGEVLAGWTGAALNFLNTDATSRDWLRPLWEAWVQRVLQSRTEVIDAPEALQALAGQMATEEVESGIARLLQSMRDPVALLLIRLLDQIPQPWTKAVSDIYIQVTRKVFQHRETAEALRWSATLPVAAVALAADAISDALQPWPLRPGEQGVWQAAALERHLQQFGETLRWRRGVHRILHEQQQR